MKKIGIWIDKREAKVVTIEKNEVNIHTIVSNVEDFHPKGGSGTRFKGGPQDVVQDSKYFEREKHQLERFFKKIVSSIDSAEKMVIFGPAQTGDKLNNFLSDKYSSLHQNIISVKKTDNMTDNQIVAWVKDCFQLKK